MKSDRYIRYVTCECCGHALAVSVWKDDPDIFISWWHSGHTCHSLWRRLKATWEFFKTSTYEHTDIILNRDEVSDFIDYLHEAMNMASAPQTLQEDKDEKDI